MSNRFVFLGLHGKEVTTVPGNVARVRMYVGDKEYDEDFDLPKIPRGTVPETVEAYSWLLEKDIYKRMKELEVQNV